MRRLLIALTPGLLLVGACDGDDGQQSVAAAGTGPVIITQPDTWATVAPGANGATNTSYIVRSGDSLWAISQAHCTSVAVLLQLNQWPEGENRILQPGDRVWVPGAPCTSGDGGDNQSGADSGDGSGDDSGDGSDDDSGDGASTTAAAPPTTQVASDKQVQAWIDSRDGFVPDPMYGDPSNYYEDFGPVCMQAWGRTYEFEKHGLGRDDVHAALQPLPGRTPADVMASIDRWAAFTDQWYIRYQALIDEYADSDGDTDYEALVRNRDYLTFLAHYVPLAGDQVAAHEYATNLCADLLEDNGSTP